MYFTVPSSSLGGEIFGRSHARTFFGRFCRLTSPAKNGLCAVPVLCRGPCRVDAGPSRAPHFLRERRIAAVASAQLSKDFRCNALIVSVEGWSRCDASQPRPRAMRARAALHHMSHGRRHARHVTRPLQSVAWMTRISCTVHDTGCMASLPGRAIGRHHHLLCAGLTVAALTVAQAYVMASVAGHQEEQKPAHGADIPAVLHAHPPLKTGPADMPVNDSGLAAGHADILTLLDLLAHGSRLTWPSLGQLVDIPVSGASGSLTQQGPTVSWAEPLHAELPDWLCSSLDPDAGDIGVAPMGGTRTSSSGVCSVVSQHPTEAQETDTTLELAKTSHDLRVMASQGTPATQMLGYLSCARNVPSNTVSAEAVLLGMLEQEQGQAHLSPSATFPTSIPKWVPMDELRGTSPAFAASQSLDCSISPKLYQCDQCPLVFDRTFNLREHLKTHDPDRVKTFFCPLPTCTQASHRRADMHRHIKTVHIQKEKLSPSVQRQILAAYPLLGTEFPPHKKRGRKSQ